MYAMKAGGSEAHGEAKRQPIKFFSLTGHDKTSAPHASMQWAGWSSARGTTRAAIES